MKYLVKYLIIFSVSIFGILYHLIWNLNFIPKEVYKDVKEWYEDPWYDRNDEYMF